MPFIAKHRLTGERIDITTLASPRLSLRPEECVCPLCDGPLIVKAGRIVVHHFAHKVACTSDWGYHPESPQHLAGKRYLRDTLPLYLDEYKDARIEYEVQIPEIRRVVDVLATLPLGWRIAHEVQLASITVEELEERTIDYNSAGIDVLWWLGGNAATPANESWCYSVFGFSLGLHFSRGVPFSPLSPPD